MGLAMVSRKAFVHPLGWLMLAASLALAGVAALELHWSGQAVWLALWGVAAYLTVALYVGWAGRVPRRTQTPPSDPIEAAERTTESQTLLHLTEQALRHLGNPAGLASSGLIERLPVTLAAASPQKLNGEPATPLESAQRLRLVMDTALSKLLRLGASDSATGHPEALQYQILNEHYVGGRPASYSMTRHSISESTFHRYRREAIRAIATDLAAQEAMLARASSSKQ
jgi:hypothetical protein